MNYPNVHGYCPSGTNVSCIVESCGNDPRVLNVALTQLEWAGATGYHHAAVRAAHANSAKAVVADDDNRWMQYIAAPLAGTLGAPLLGISANGPTAEDLALLSDLGVSEILMVGPVAGSAAFTGASMSVDVITASSDLATASQEVAAHITTINDINRTVTVETIGLSAEAAPAAAALAALGGFPLMVGSAAAAAVGYPTLYIGPEPADVSLISDRTTATTLIPLSVELAELASAATDRLSEPDRHRPGRKLGRCRPGQPRRAGRAPPARLARAAGDVDPGSLGSLWRVDRDLLHVRSRSVDHRGVLEASGAANGFRVDQLQVSPAKAFRFTANRCPSARSAWLGETVP